MKGEPSIAFIRRQALPVLHWIRKSTRANPDHAGSAAYYSLFSGWADPYPETTGYLIPTLYDYGRVLDDPQWTSLAGSCSRWLLRIQLENGAFPISSGNKNPLVFDTGMILFGLLAAWSHTKEGAYFEALDRAARWVAGCLEPAGYWKQHCFTPGFSPAYHSRIVWALLESSEILQSDALRGLCEKAHSFHLAFFNNRHGIKDAGFAPGEPATTHTLAYSLRGMLESACILNDQAAIGKVALAASKLLALLTEKGKLAGAYDENWKGDYRFACITGHAQLSILFFRFHELTQTPAFLAGARQLFEEIADAPSKVPLVGIRGGIAGSRPLWGPYQRFRWLNWAAKFYLDAALAYADH